MGRGFLLRQGCSGAQRLAQGSAETPGPSSLGALAMDRSLPWTGALSGRWFFWLRKANVTERTPCVWPFSRGVPVPTSPRAASETPRLWRLFPWGPPVLRRLGVPFPTLDGRKNSGSQGSASERPLFESASLRTTEVSKRRGVAGHRAKGTEFPHQASRFLKHRNQNWTSQRPVTAPATGHRWASPRTPPVTAVGGLTTSHAEPCWMALPFSMSLFPC